LQDLVSYFSSRDLTLNEVLVMGDKVICTVQCLEDIINGILAPTQHIRGSSGKVDSMVFVKMLRFAAIAEVEGAPVKIERVGEVPEVSDFNLALHLNRALSRGSRVAEIFLKLCVEWGVLSLAGAKKLSVGDVVSKLSKSMSAVPLQKKARGKSFSARRKRPRGIKRGRN